MAVSLRRSLLAVLVVLGLPTGALALGGPDTQGCWSFSDTIAPTDANAPTFAFTDISATGTQATLPNTSTMAGPFPIGFSFDFYGATYTQFSISPNGFITFLPSRRCADRG